MKRLKERKGFTLVELVIVIAVIAVLSAILIPTFATVIKNANVAKYQASIKSMNMILVERAVLEDNRESYTADEVKQILTDNGFDLKGTPDGYSIWYDRNVNNVYLLENSVAFSSSAPAAATAAVAAGFPIAFADTSEEIVPGNRAVEALNPYAPNLLYIDQSNEAVTQNLSALKSVVRTAEATSDVGAAIKNEFETRYRAIAEAIPAAGITAAGLYQAFDVDNTLFIGEKGMYVPGLSGKTSGEIICTNSFVDANVYGISADQKLAGNQNVTVKVDISIELPSRVAYIVPGAFVGLTATSGSISVIANVSAVVETGDWTVSISVSTYKSALDATSIQYGDGNALIQYERDYTCTFSSEGCQYVVRTESGTKKGKLTGEQTLSSVAEAAGAFTAYLVPVFDILQSEAGFFTSFGNVESIVVNSMKNGDITTYTALLIREEDGVLKGYRFSNIGYLTNVNVYSKESYSPLNHTGKTEAFPQSTAAIEVVLPEGFSQLKNLGNLTAAVTYKPIVKRYEQSTLLDGTIYYSLSGQTEGQSLTTDRAAVQNGKAVFSVDASGLTSGGFNTVDSAVEKVEIYSGDTLILVRYF